MVFITIKKEICELKVSPNPSPRTSVVGEDGLSPGRSASGRRHIA